MRLVSVGLYGAVRIPQAWTAFVYGGWLYQQGRDGRFVIGAKVEPTQTPVSQEKRLAS